MGSNGDNRAPNKQRSGLFGCALFVNLALLAAIVHLLGKRGTQWGERQRIASQFGLFNKPTVPL